MKIKTPMLFIMIALTSCISQKDVTYFQAENEMKEKEQIEIKDKPIPILKTGDILGITVSSLSPEASSMFNPYPIESANTNQTIQTTSPRPAVGYLIDSEGLITIPLVGKLKVAGLSTKEVRDLVTQKLNQYLVQPTVSINILNFKISVLGEVNRPSIYTIPNEMITLPEALCLAGDLTIFGKRNNILIIREVDGKREFARIDLTKRNLFSSPYYYLRANDVIYVEPSKGRITSTDRTIQLAPVVISALTLLTIIFSNILR